MVSKPYKFLDFYTKEDVDIFFGREREIRVLLSDILVNRLVVLFARTGTGKTSLINAGVRPRLEDQGYATFLIRVNKDPATSALVKLKCHKRLKQLKGTRLADQLADAVQQLEQPIVLFFDQFEEFFIYIYNQNSSQGREFIEDVARLYHDPNSGVHIVFSMREEFFVQMDAFRDEIPSIFNYGSHLRLRPLSKSEARDAILYPARLFDTRIDADLVHQLLIDLAEAASSLDTFGSIEPAQLQIVCDTLWDTRVDDRITLESYRKLGQRGDTSNIARQILYQRLEEGFNLIQSQAQLRLLEWLLPKLRTDEGTKYVRDVKGLMSLLETENPLQDLPSQTPPSLEDLLAQLEQMRFIQRTGRDNLEVIELIHDYLIHHLEDLQKRVRTIWPRRQLKEAFEKYRADGEYATLDCLDAVATVVDDIALDHSEVEFLFRSALAQGHHKKTLWLKEASARDIDVWAMIRDRLLRTGDAQVFHIMELLGEVAADTQQPTTQLQQAFILLRTALEREHLSSEAQDTLARLARFRETNIADRSQKILFTFLDRVMEHGVVASAAIRLLGTVETPKSISLLERALKREDITREAQAALVRLTTAQSKSIRDQATNILLDSAEQAVQKGTIAEATIGMLGQTRSTRSIGILTQALEHKHVSLAAQDMLKQLTQAKDEEVAALARQSLSQFIKSSQALEFDRRDQQRSSEPTAPSESISDSIIASIARYIERGEIILFVGAGIHLPPPPSSPYHDPENSRPPLEQELAELLAMKSGFYGSFPRESGSNLGRVALYYETRFSRNSLVNELRTHLDQRSTPSPIVHALAHLPVSLVMTTNYDRLFERTLQEAGKAPVTSVYTKARDIPTQDYDEPTVHQPHFLKLHGDIQQPESLVITEEDYIQFVLRMSYRGDYHPVPETFRYYLRRWPTLFIGYNRMDYNFRLLLRQLAWKNDLSKQPIAYMVDPHPDPLIVDVYQNRQRFIQFIGQDVWRFVSVLYRLVMGRDIPLP